MNKITTLIGYDDEKTVNDIENYIKDLNYTKVVAKTLSGKETCRKIIELKPEFVFIKFSMLDMNAIEIMQKTKQKLNKEEMPVFNIFANRLSENEIEEAYSIIREKLNAQVECNDKETIINILKEYKKYKKFKGI